MTQFCMLLVLPTTFFLLTIALYSTKLDGNVHYIIYKAALMKLQIYLISFIITINILCASHAMFNEASCKAFKLDLNKVNHYQYEHHHN